MNGSEHFAWDQSIAVSGGDINQYQFVAYLDADAVGQPLPDAACRTAGNAIAFQCDARLPPMAAGEHKLSVAAAILVNGDRLESPRSAQLNLLVVPLAAPAVSSVVHTAPAMTLTTSDGASLVIETLATGLDAPSSLARTADGRVFVAERSGYVRVWQGGSILPQPAFHSEDAAIGTDAGLVGITLAPDFTQSRQLYLAYTARSGVAFVNRVIRLREVGNILGEAASILEDPVDRRPARTPHIAFGPDGKLYVAFQNDPVGRRDSANYLGKLLRLNKDGTTPRDNAGSSPVVAGDDGVTAAFDWQPETGDRWDVIRGPSGQGTVRRSGNRMNSNSANLDPAIDTSAAMFYRGDAIPQFKGDLFVSALAGGQIERLRVDSAIAGRVVPVESLLDHVFGRLADVVQGGDGALYFCTSNKGASGSGAAVDDRLVRIGAAPRR